MSSDSRDRAIDESKLKIGVAALPVISSLLEFSEKSDINCLDNEVYANLAKLSDEIETVKQQIEARQRIFRRQRQALDADVKRLLDNSKPSRPSPRRHDKQNQKNAQKSTRHERAHQSSANMNLWHRVDAFFRPVPSDADIDALFSDRLAGPGVPDVPPGIHWSQRFETIVRKSQGRAMSPPGPSSAGSEINSYWRKEPPAFQLEKMQMRNESVLHCLLSAFVEAEPERDTADRTNDVSEASQVLLPFVEFDPYLSHGFDTRLRLELESAGLNKYDEQVEIPHNAFDIEIRELKEQVRTELRPELDRIHDELTRMMPRIRAKQSQMADEAAIYRTMVSELNHKKKKR